MKKYIKMSKDRKLIMRGIGDRHHRTIEMTEKESKKQVSMFSSYKNADKADYSYTVTIPSNDVIEYVLSLNPSLKRPNKWHLNMSKEEGIERRNFFIFLRSLLEVVEIDVVI